MKVGIVIPVLNQFELAVGAIYSICTKNEYVVYIAPNWLSNRGVAGAWNDGIEKAFNNHCDYVLVINDDVILSPWTIDNQIKVIEDNVDNNFVLTTGWSTTPPNPSHPMSMMNYGEPSWEAAWIPGADFACFMITYKCWKEVGRFDENLYPAYFEDNDYHRRILMAGLDARIVPQAPYFHYGSRTQKAGEVVSSDVFEKNKAYYISKWGGVPGAEIYSTPYNDPNVDLKYIRQSA